MTHVEAIMTRLEHEKERLAKSRTEGERKMRSLWVDKARKELADEIAFLKKAKAEGRSLQPIERIVIDGI